MKSQTVNIDNHEYIKIPILEFSQNSNNAYIATMNILDFQKISELRQIDIDKIPSYQKLKIEDVGSHIKEKKNLKEEPFNRPEDQERVGKILNYLNQGDEAIIPGALIVGLEAKINNIEFEFEFPNNEKTLEQITDKDWLVTFNNTDGAFIHDNHLYVDLKENKAIIIDGQHRYLAMAKLSEEKKESFSIPIVFLLGYQPKKQADLFYTINYEQKPVNKSLLINLKNTFLDKLTESKVIFKYIEFLNSDSRSPLYKKINMYGKGKGYISLASLYSLIKDMTKVHSSRSTKISVFSSLYEDEKNRYIILQLLLDYLRAIKDTIEKTHFNKLNEIKDDKYKCDDDSNLWDDNCTILTKTVGIGAFFLVFPKIILKILDDKKTTDNYMNLKDITKSDFEKELQNINNFDFNRLSTGSSLGLMNKIKDEFIKLFDLKKYDKDFFEKLKWKHIKS